MYITLLSIHKSFALATAEPIAIPKSSNLIAQTGPSKSREDFLAERIVLQSKPQAPQSTPTGFLKLREMRITLSAFLTFSASLLKKANLSPRSAIFSISLAINSFSCSSTIANTNSSCPFALGAVLAHTSKIFANSSIISFSGFIFILFLLEIVFKKFYINPCSFKKLTVIFWLSCDFSSSCSFNAKSFPL